MRRLRMMITGLALVALAAVETLAAQPGRLRGRVSDSAGTGLPGAVVTVEGTLLRATAGAQGDYELRNIPAGSYTVRARLIGHAPASAQVTVPPGGDIQRNFAEVGYLLPRNLNVSVGVRNLFDKYPDSLNASNGFGIFLYPQPSPFGYNGRFVYTRVEVAFGR